MKIVKSILAGAIALASVSAARADVTVYITGSTAYRNAAITGIEALYGAGNYACLYATKAGVTSEKNATNAVFFGPVSGQGNVTVSTGFLGSVGGMEIVVQRAAISSQSGGQYIALNPSQTNNANNALPAIGTTTGVAVTSLTLDTTTTADGTFSDCFQATGSSVAAASKPISGLIGAGTDTTNGIVGVVPFEWVANNGASAVSVITLSSAYGVGATVLNYSAVSGTALAIGQAIGGKGIPIGATITGLGAGTITISAPTTAAADSGLTITAGTAASNPIANIGSLLTKQLLTGGAVYLSQFTGVVTDNKPVWMFGRNTDSGTRVAYLAESGRGVTQAQQVVQPAFTPAGGGSGKGGLPSLQVTSIYRWPADSSLLGLLGQTYGVGASGYSSGGDLANAMSAWGSISNASSAGGTAPALSGSIGLGGWFVACLGRADAATATATTFGLNTAHRITWNGVADWTGAFDYTGRPVSGSYNDAAIQEGSYTMWEYEHLYVSPVAGADQTTYLNSLAASIIANDPGTDSIPVSTMHVNRGTTIEGQVIVHN